MKTKIHAGLTLLFAFSMVAVISCGKSSSGYTSTGTGTGTGTTPTTNSVRIYNMAFNSSNLTVTAGTTVTWRNDDGMAHTVTADDNSFDSGNIPGGSSFSRKFSTVGTFPYHCNIHSGMTGKVTVK